MADGDSERDPIDFEQPSPAVGYIKRLFFQGDLVLRLVADDLALTRDDERHVVQPGGGFPLHADDRRHAVLLRRGADLLQRLLLATLVGWWDRKIAATQAGDVGLRKTDDGDIARRRLPQEALDCRQSFIDGWHIASGGQSDA
jgi:hypothetical protein